MAEVRLDMLRGARHHLRHGAVVQSVLDVAVLFAALDDYCSVIVDAVVVVMAHDDF